MTALDDVSRNDLMPVFVPAQAAELLRRLGLSGMTECALRTRAYRRQVPFHRNGNRIMFTLADLKEIAEGEAQRPEPRKRPGSRPSSHLTRGRSRTRQRTDVENGPAGAWRARRSL